MMTKPRYDRELRTIGQSLEARRIHIFKLQYADNRYVVTGEPEKRSSLFFGLRRWQEGLRSKAFGNSLLYVPQDLEHLEIQGRKQRGQPGRLPDFYSLPNILRTLGSYLNGQGAELIEFQKRPLTLTLLYRNREGHPHLEERSIASFHHYFIELHGRRRAVPTS